MKRLTKRQIVMETVRYYAASPNKRRATASDVGIGGGSCMMLTDDGRKCAFGRCMIEPWLDDTSSASSRLQNSGQKCLKVKYRGHDGLDFWDVLQSLHDLDEHWTKNGLSLKGAAYCKVHFELDITAGRHPTIKKKGKK